MRLLACLVVAAMATARPAAADDAAQQIGTVVQDVKQAADTVQGLPEKGIDAAGQAVRNNLPPELAPVAGVATELAKTLANVSSGKLISDAVGTAFDKFGSVMADMVGDSKKLLARVEQLEKDNTQKMIEIEHSKANVQALDAKLTQTTAVLTELLERHKQQIAELDTRIAKLEAERGVVKAPFKVVSASGKALFQVDAYGNSQFQGATGQGAIGIGFVGDGASIAAFSPHGSFAASIGESGGQLQVQSDSGKTSAYVIASDKAGLHLTSGEKHTDLAADEDLFGLKLSQGEKPAASLGTLPGKGVALRLFNTQGQQVVSAGANPDQGGAGIVAAGVSDGSRSAAILSGQQDGSGLVQAFAADGTGAAALVGKERSVAAYNKAGNPVATIGQSDKSEGGTVVARNPGGEGIFAAGFASEYGGGEACVWRAKRRNTFCLGLGMPGMGVGK